MISNISIFTKTPNQIFAVDGPQIEIALHTLRCLFFQAGDGHLRTGWVFPREFSLFFAAHPENKTKRGTPICMISFYLYYREWTKSGFARKRSCAPAFPRSRYGTVC
ncbi:hypothetical protein GWI33_004279 [Rhynchophorus ferrugineus]|uniref:Uncharacterized protein n=1 Tax=Rhynchophorus ferrugineus TaxID=354439 RepID=A0A834IQD7_RHYFE|nr:hypothetical protein GWI33_004279 [Rhynchophorus ferrugineus]